MVSEARSREAATVSELLSHISSDIDYAVPDSIDCFNENWPIRDPCGMTFCKDGCDLQSLLVTKLIFHFTFNSLCNHRRYSRKIALAKSSTSLDSLNNRVTRHRDFQISCSEHKQNPRKSVKKQTRREPDKLTNFNVELAAIYA